MGNWKWKISKISKLNDFFKSHSLSNLYSNTLKKHSKRIIETEPTRWLQSKDPWKLGWVRHFN